MSDKWFYVILAVLGGVSISPQGAINALLGRYVGNLQATAVSFAVGLLVVSTACLLLRGVYPGSWGRIVEAPAWAFTGGLLGAIIVLTTLLSVPKIGATPTLLAILIGQVLISVVMDHYGLFGLEAQPVALRRIVGLGLLLAGLPLVLR